MNLLLRLVWMILTARFRSRCAILEESRLPFRVLPTDLDVNMHLTNSRYFSFMDLSRIDHLMRNGAWKTIRANKYMPVLGSGSIRFRRPVPPFKRIDVTTRIVGCDDKWAYLEHTLISGTTLYAVAILKAAFLDSKGRVPTNRLLNEIGYDGQIPPMTPELEMVRDVDDGLLKIVNHRLESEVVSAETVHPV